MDIAVDNLISEVSLICAIVAFTADLAVKYACCALALFAETALADNTEVVTAAKSETATAAMITTITSVLPLEAERTQPTDSLNLFVIIKHP